jgi:diketogulonate reductase-like aldo/keto reductase
MSQLSLHSTLPLPNSPHKIPQLGFGVYQSPPETCVKSCLTALKAGYRHIDTAQYYANEEQVGKALKESGLKREEVYLTTKILSPGNDVDSTYKSVLESVEKLSGKDGYVDLFLIHSPNAGPEKRKLMWLALEKAKEEGKAREIGVSNYGIGHIEEIKKIGKVWPPAVNQIEVRSASSSICTPLTHFSFTLGASRRQPLNTAKRTTLSSKPTVRSSATRRRKTRHCKALRRSTT